MVPSKPFNFSILCFYIDQTAARHYPPLNIKNEAIFRVQDISCRSFLVFADLHHQGSSAIARTQTRRCVGRLIVRPRSLVSSLVRSGAFLLSATFSVFAVL